MFIKELLSREKVLWNSILSLSNLPMDAEEAGEAPPRSGRMFCRRTLRRCPSNLRALLSRLISPGISTWDDCTATAAEKCTSSARGMWLKASKARLASEGLLFSLSTSERSLPAMSARLQRVRPEEDAHICPRVGLFLFYFIFLSLKCDIWTLNRFPCPLSPFCG